MDSGMAWTLVSLGFVLLLIVVLAWPASAVWRARAGAKREDEYRELADRSARQLEHAERERLALELNVADLSARLAAVEQMLAEVD